MKGSSNSDDFTVFYPSVDLAPLKGFCPLFWLVISISFSPHDQSLIFCSHLDFSDVLLVRVLPALHTDAKLGDRRLGTGIAETLHLVFI